MPTQPHSWNSLPQNPQKLCWRVWHPAVPTQPLTQPTICVDLCNPWENYIPTEPTERTEASCREGSPTDSTDLHRCRRVWHPAVPTQPLTQPTICVDQCNPWENYIPQNPRNAQKFLVEKSLPQISRMRTAVGGYGILPYPRSQQHPQTSVSSVNSVGELTQPTICVDQCNPWENCIPTEPTERTEASCREGSPTDSTDLHRCRRVWHPAIPTHPLTQPNFCEFCGFRGRTNATNHLC